MKFDQRRIDILNYLFDYRGMNAKQMTTFVYMTPFYTISNLKQVQRELKGLVDNGYVTKFFYNEPLVDDEGIIKQQKVSMYYLTQKGYTYMLEYFNVLQGQRGSGFLLNDDFIYGDIPYETFTPPQKLVDHHLMAINAFIRMSFFEKQIPHRNNLYAAKKIGNNKLRPDAEALINDKVYYLEFDRYTENHAKLVEKFEGYATYLETLTKEELKRQGKIVFVVDDKGVDRRWNNILAAFYKGIGRFKNTISVSLCLEYELNEFLKIELDQPNFKSDFIRYLNTVGNHNKSWSFDSQLVFYENKQNEIEFSTFTHRYDSSLLIKYQLFKEFIIQNNLKTSDSGIFITLHNFKETKLNLEHYNVDPQTINDYATLQAMIKKTIRYHKIVLNEYDNTGNITNNDSYDIYADEGI